MRKDLPCVSVIVRKYWRSPMELQVPTGQYESAFELDLQPVVQVFAFTTCNLVHCTTKRGYHCQYFLDMAGPGGLMSTRE